MTPYRRITFQLVPLLDLMLIVFFAQYLEMQVITRKATERHTQEQARLSRESTRLKTQVARLKSDLATSQEIAAAADQLSRQVRELQAERQQTAGLVRQLFRIPADQLTVRLRPGTAERPGLTAEEIGVIQARLQGLGNATTEEVINHLVTFEELRKRCDIWEVYLQSNGVTVLNFGDRRLEFRGETPDQFGAKLYESYKALPEPKSLVLLLVSYGDAKFSDRLAAFDALPAALERMRSDTNGVTRFEYAILGYRQPPTP